VTAVVESPPATRRRSWKDVAVPAALVGATAGTRVVNLGRPRAFLFDEIYYAPDAAELLRRGVEKGGVVHPPGGKWLIAAGLRVFGFTSFGWRFGALVAGCLVVLLTYIAARQIVQGYWLPALAGAAVALDGVSFTTGRLGMLDVFLALFTTAAIACTLGALRDPTNVRRVRWCQLGAGVALGLGLTVKWSAAYLLLAVLLAFLWMHAQRPAGERHGRAVVGTVLTLTVLPVGIYCLAYVPWIINADKTYIHIIDCRDHNDCDLSIENRIRQLIEDQNRIRVFQQESLQDNNSNSAPAWKWINQRHPTILYRKTCIPALAQAPADENDAACAGASNGQIVEYVTVANPVLWFAGLAAALVLLWRAIWRRDLIALFLLLAVVHQWFPWAISPRHAYSFYLAPLIPGFALWAVYACSRRPFRWVAPIFAVLLVAAFAFFYPIWAGSPLSPSQLHAREYWTWLS
jgi:dolichyl-phosphate-mannose--protein O-mannosyl transferase